MPKPSHTSVMHGQSQITGDGSRAARTRLQRGLDLIRWDRPAGWLLLLWPTLTALWLAAGGWPGWHLLLVFFAGTVLMRSAGCCINDVADREFDKHVKRTAGRPVTSGEVSVREALSIGAALALVALGLVLTTNAATVAWAVPALLVTLIYPYAKRLVAMPQAVLGVAFSFGIPMAYSAVQAGPPGQLWPSTGWTWVEAVQSWQSIPTQAWILLLGNLFWVLAYDTEYAMVDRDDDLRIGMKTSAITLGRWDVPGVMVFYGLSLLCWCMAVGPLVAAPPFVLAAVAAVLQAGWHYTLIRDRQREGCFRAFKANHWFGATVFLGVVLALSWG